MAPHQVPNQLPWRDAHPFFLLSPLMALLSRAWSRLRGPGPPKPWLVEAEQSADQGEASLQVEAEAASATHYAPWGGHPTGVPEDSGAAVEDGESSWMACPALKANSSIPEAWELSDENNQEYGGEEATSGPTEQGSEYIGGQLAPPSPSLLKTLRDPPGEEESEEGGGAEDKAIMFSFPPSHSETCPGMEEEEDREAISEEAPRTSTSPLAPGSKPRAWVYCAGEAEAPAKEEERTENKEARKTSTSCSCAGSHPSAWECYSGEDPEEEGEGEVLSSIPPTNTFLRAWVYRPGEDTEDEEEEEEDSDSGAAEGPSSISPTSAFSRSWVYRPGEEGEEEEEENEKDGSEAAGSEPGSSFQSQSAAFGGWRSAPAKETQGGEAEPHPFQVAIYLPGEKPPPPWALPRLPARLQRRLKSAETPTQHLDPETPQKTTKVRFSEKVSIHYLVVWAGPAQAARQGPWEQFARDRSRFARRIAQVEEVLGPCFTLAARARAWARLGNPSPALAVTPATTQTSSTSSAQATPLSHTVISPFPVFVAMPPCLDLSWRRG
uniref:Protein phosphatase 1 regulatory subunit 15A n=1 Tax=Desmodus rotundus TaxID=9430 RepID=K9IM54_DESRO